MLHPHQTVPFKSSVPTVSLPRPLGVTQETMIKGKLFPAQQKVVEGFAIPEVLHDCYVHNYILYITVGNNFQTQH